MGRKSTSTRPALVSTWTQHQKERPPVFQKRWWPVNVRVERGREGVEQGRGIKESGSHGGGIWWWLQGSPVCRHLCVHWLTFNWMHNWKGEWKCNPTPPLYVWRVVGSEWVLSEPLFSPGFTTSSWEWVIPATILGCSPTSDIWGERKRGPSKWSLWPPNFVMLKKIFASWKEPLTFVFKASRIQCDPWFFPLS